MNKKETEIDQLTRGLMHDTAEQPSASLNARIMALIRKTRRRPAEIYLGRTASPGLILGVFTFYMLCLGLGAFCLFGSGGKPSLWIAALKTFFPLVVIGGGILSSFFCLAQLDNWLYRRAKNKEEQRAREVQPD